LCEADRELKLLSRHPERLAGGIVEGAVPVWIGPQEPAAHPERFASVAHLIDAPDHVLEYHECSDRLHCSLRTWKRILAEGQGPPVIDISANRRGVFESDFYRWLLTRRRYAPGSVALQPTAVEGSLAEVKRARGRPRKQPLAAAAE
jgi:hypothetical protein